MGASITVTIDTSTLDRIAKNLNTTIHDVGNQMSFKIEGYAKSYAPVDTGALRTNINAQQYSHGGIISEVGVFVNYATYQEMGTYKMAAHPYLMPACNDVFPLVWDSNNWSIVFR